MLMKQTNCKKRDSFLESKWKLLILENDCSKKTLWKRRIRCYCYEENNFQRLTGKYLTIQYELKASCKPNDTFKNGNQIE